MGPSGCGKTTLLNVLARRAASSGAKTTGDCLVNGIKPDTETFGRITSYVEQEDALIGSLTVYETLKFAADLSLPGYVTSETAAYADRLLTAKQICIEVAAKRAYPDPPKVFRYPRPSVDPGGNADPQGDQWWPETTGQRRQSAYNVSQGPVSGRADKWTRLHCQL